MKQTYIRTEIIRENKNITPEDYYCYKAHNNGKCDVFVDSVRLKQGETIDFTTLPKDSIYQSVITVIFGTNDTEKELVFQQIKITNKK